MRKPDQIVEPDGWLERRGRLAAAGRDWLRRLEDVETIVDEVTDNWAIPSVNGADFEPDATSAPSELRAAFSRTDREDPLVAAAGIVCGRALARGLLQCEPTWAHWERAVELRAEWSFDAFCEEFPAGDPTRISAWVRVLVSGSPAPAESVSWVGEHERNGVIAASKDWREKPTAFHWAITRSHHSLRASIRLAYWLLRQLNLDAWFEAIRLAALPDHLGEEVSFIARDPDELLRCLKAAPPAISENGAELQDVIGTLLARAALDVPRHIQDALAQRARWGTDETARTSANVELETYRHTERSADLETVVAVILDRADGEPMGRILFSKLVDEATRLTHTDDEHAPLLAAMDALAHGLSARFPRGPDELHAWYAAAHVTANEDAIVRWLTLVVSEVHAGATDEAMDEMWATRAIELLIEDLHRGVTDTFRFTDPVRIPSWAVPRCGVVLSSMPGPAERFRTGFAQLEVERMRERAMTDAHAPATASRFLTYVGLAALGQMRDGGLCHCSEEERLALANHTFDAVRTLWLRPALEIGGDVENIVVYTYAWLALALGVSSPFVADALSYVTTDPSLSVRVAAAWRRNQQSAEDVAEAFEIAGTPLSVIIARLAGATAGMRPSDDDLDMCRETVARASHANP